MRILYHIPHPNVNGAERWIFEAWRSGFRRLGHTVETLKFEDILLDKAIEFKPDLFITDISVINLNKDGDTINKMRSGGIKVAMMTFWPPLGSAVVNKLPLTKDSYADIYFGERVDDHLPFAKDTGLEYTCIPNSANPDHHFPVKAEQSYASDILYIGTNLPHKAWFVKNILKELRKNKKYKVQIIGRGWTFSDFSLRVIRKILILLKMIKLKKFIENRTVKFSDDEERLYYSSAKICLNFHEREPDGSQPHYIVNQRTFKIAACGGFQICDDAKAINDYFENNKEIILLPLNKKKWLDTIAYYLKNETARERIRAKSTKRALDEHMSTNRCLFLLNKLGLEKL